MASSPKSPNPYQQAGADQRAQQGAAYASSIINNPNEQSNYGSVNYKVSGWEQVPDAQGKMTSVPRYTRTTTLSPDEQRIAGYDTATRYNLGRTATQQSAKIGDYLNKGMDTSSWQPWTAGKDFQEATDRPEIEKQMMQSYHRTADPQAAAQQAQLAARGLSPGSQGYGTVQQGQLDAESEAARQAYLASGGEARANYQTAQAHWDQLNQLRQAQAQEGFALRNQPINEIMALMGGSQVNMPNFSPFSRQGISASSPGQYMASNYQNQLASTNAFNQGLFGLLGAGGQAAGSYYGRK